MPQNNKGFCFFEYADPRATDKAIKGLNNMEFRDKKLKVQLKSLGQKQQIGGENGIQSMQQAVEEEQRLVVPPFCTLPSRCVQFLNMLSACDLLD